MVTVVVLPALSVATIVCSPSAGLTVNLPLVRVTSMPLTLTVSILASTTVNSVASQKVLPSASSDNAGGVLSMMTFRPSSLIAMREVVVFVTSNNSTLIVVVPSGASSFILKERVIRVPSGTMVDSVLTVARNLKVPVFRSFCKVNCSWEKASPIVTPVSCKTSISKPIPANTPQIGVLPLIVNGTSNSLPLLRTKSSVSKDKLETPTPLLSMRDMGLAKVVCCGGGFEAIDAGMLVAKRTASIFVLSTLFILLIVFLGYSRLIVYLGASPPNSLICSAKPLLSISKEVIPVRMIKLSYAGFPDVTEKIGAPT